jgi:predicted amidohydrolase
MKIHLSRWVCLDVETNLARMEAEARAAAERGADLVVFPESFLHGYTQRFDPSRARGLFGRISSDHPSTLFLFGSISEERRNRMTLWRDGLEAARYDKIHLFGPNGEFDLWERGERYVAASVDGIAIGLINCNDVRFPEQARALRLRAGCQVLLAVAWWPFRRDHLWRALLRARAIENAAWVVACCLAASRAEGEIFDGAGNYVFDPDGDLVLPENDTEYDLPLERPVASLVDPVANAVEIERVETIPVTAARARS